MNTESILEQKRALQKAGYIVLQIHPAMWRARGPVGYVDLWLVDLLYRREYSSARPQPYEADRVVALVVGYTPPFETMDAWEEYLFDEWKEGLRLLMVGYPQLSTCGK